MNMNSYSCCQRGSKEDKSLKELIPILKVVAEESRIKILCILKQGKHCVCELTEHLPLSQSLISHHLRDLKDADIVTNKKHGLRVYYSLTNKGEQLTDSLFKLISV